MLCRRHVARAAHSLGAPPLCVALLPLCVSLVGCYAAHERRPDASFARNDDASVIADMGPDLGTWPDGARACVTRSVVLDVPAGGCAETSLPSTAGNVCDWTTGRVEQLIHIRRSTPFSGGTWHWSFTVDASGDHARGYRLAMGFADGCACETDMSFEANTPGDGARIEGERVGSGAWPAELDVVIDAGGGPASLRVCS